MQPIPLNQAGHKLRYCEWILHIHSDKQNIVLKLYE